MQEGGARPPDVANLLLATHKALKFGWMNGAGRLLLAACMAFLCKTIWCLPR
jgi:hypothetical protein